MTPGQEAAATFRDELAPLLALAEAHPDAVELCVDGSRIKLDLGDEWRHYTFADFPGLSEKNVSAAANAAATFADKQFGPTFPSVPRMSVKIPPDLRVSVVCPPLSEEWDLTIRFLRSKSRSLADYVGSGIMTDAQADQLRELLHQRRNIIVSGQTASGKTTLLRTLLELVKHERILILEDTPELSVRGGAARHYSTTATTDLSDLLHQALRMRPDRIVVGEVRGPEALELIRSCNTGQEGMLGTLHSNGQAATLHRLHTLVLEAQPLFPEAMIRSAIHYDVHLEGRGSRRRLSSIWKVPALALALLLPSLTAAAPAVAETIILQPGRYGALHLDGQSGVTYRCATPGACTVGSGSTIRDSRGVTLDGLRFDGGAIGLTIGSSHDVTVQGSTFNEQSSSGVLVDPGRRSSGVRIVNNAFSNRSTGCNHNDPSNCSGHLPDGSPVAGMDYGVRVYGADSVEISGNRFASLFNHAISLKSDVGQAAITDNRFDSCGRTCIELGQESMVGGALIARNILSGATMNGIVVKEIQRLALIDNRFQINGRPMLDADGVAQITQNGTDVLAWLGDLPDWVTGGDAWAGWAPPVLEDPTARRRRILGEGPRPRSCCDDLSPEARAKAMQRPWN